MDIPFCEHVRSMLYASGRAQPSALRPELVEHLASCQLCRGALLALATALLPQQAQLLAETSCEACQASLDAFIDLEQAEGTTSARDAYPQVWWHMWICLTCAELYDWTRLLVDAQQRGTIAPLPFTPSREARSALIRPSSPRIQQILRAQVQLGVAWSDDEPGFVIAETTAEGHAIRLYLLHISDEHSQATVIVQPPSAGSATLILGQDVYQTDLDAMGWGVFAELPTSAITTAHTFELNLLFDDPLLLN